MKAALQYRASPGLRQKLTALDFSTVVDETDKDTFRREIADANILLHGLEPVTAAVIDAAPYLRLIQKIGIGINTVNLDAARAQGNGSNQHQGGPTMQPSPTALRATVPTPGPAPEVEASRDANQVMYLAFTSGSSLRQAVAPEPEIEIISEHREVGSRLINLLQRKATFFWHRHGMPEAGCPIVRAP
jgi:hypothetical protein